MPRYIYTIGLQGWSRSTTIIRRRPRPAITSKTGVGARHLQGPTHYIWCQHVIFAYGGGATDRRLPSTSTLRRVVRRV